MRIAPLLILLLAFVPALPVLGQAPVLAPDDTIRLWSAAPPRDGWIGTLTRLTADSLFASAGSGETLASPLHALQRLQVRRGSRASRAIAAVAGTAGMTAGMFAGAKLGYNMTCRDCEGIDGMGGILLGMAAGGLLGGLGGRLLGSRAREPNWVEVPITRSGGG